MTYAEFVNKFKQTELTAFAFANYKFMCSVLGEDIVNKLIEESKRDIQDYNESLNIDESMEAK